MNEHSRKVMHSTDPISGDHHKTDPAFVKAVETHFGIRFVLDAAASKANAQAPNFFALDHDDPSRRDGLAASWKVADEVIDGARSAVFVNPPYGRSETRTWLAKAAQEAQNGTPLVCLVPSRTGSRWHHEAVEAGGAVVFIKGRLKFGGQKSSAPFDSVLITWNLDPKGSMRNWDWKAQQ